MRTNRPFSIGLYLAIAFAFSCRFSWRSSSSVTDFDPFLLSMIMAGVVGWRARLEDIRRSYAISATLSLATAVKSLN